MAGPRLRRRGGHEPPYRTAIKTGTSTHFGTSGRWPIPRIIPWPSGRGISTAGPPGDLRGAGAAAPMVADLGRCSCSPAPPRSLQPTRGGGLGQGVLLLRIETRTGVRRPPSGVVHRRHRTPGALFLSTNPRNPGTACPRTAAAVWFTSATKKAAKADSAWPTLIRT